jgi:1,4-alpha-glucan branching enzyme
MAARKSEPKGQTATHVPNPVSLITSGDLHLFREGTHYRLYDKLGAHRMEVDGRWGTYFAVWAPNARNVSVIGDFNHWKTDVNPLERHPESGIWEGFVPAVDEGVVYKYRIVSGKEYAVDKADPFAFSAELPPGTASRVTPLDYEWHDSQWMRDRHILNAADKAISVYEIHLGSWRRVPEEGNRFLTYREVAAPLAEYMRKMGFTHVEFLPIMEHPFYGSWGYQVTGYFAPTARYGSPQDLRYLIDYLHEAGLGVILDWVPSHFPRDEHGLTYFDGSHLYEYADPRKGEHAEWGSNIFDYTRGEVQSFLLSSAMFWLDRYHVDGLRVDAVASMLHLDYGRGPGEWVPNEHGGRENLEAIEFLSRFNADVQKAYPGVLTIAEESTSRPGTTKPVTEGGLGFSMKWDMGWMHDTLRYFGNDAINRKQHQNDLTFRGLYASNEKYMVSLSHDEVVYGKGSLLSRMPGDAWQKAANLRLLFGYMYSLPGKKLMFMGDEFGQTNEWYHERSLDWHELNDGFHAGVQRWVEELNGLYRRTAALHEYDFDSRGFEWINADDSENSVLSYLRRGRRDEALLIVCNFTPVPRHNYRVGVPKSGYWREVLNSDAREYGGSGQGNMGGIESDPVPFHGCMQSVNLFWLSVKWRRGVLR